MSTHSPGANCEEDVSVGALDSMSSFLLSDINNNNISSPNDTISITIPAIPAYPVTFPKFISTLVKNTRAFVAGYQIKTIFFLK